ncbi:MAG: zinc-dependent alcohol dehydrogenase [Acidimicrobiales bacterium]
MKALQMERSLPRFATARLASGWRSGAGARVGPLRLVEVDPPELPGPEWVRVEPILSGICGSDLATVDGRSSRWFEPIVSFPFTPGHEVVGRTEDGRRVVVEPVLCCEVRGIDPPCDPCAEERTNHCQHLSAGHLKPGLQTGYCSQTGGGWSGGLVAHTRQLHSVPDGLGDQAAVMIEPVACALHGALRAPGGDDLAAVVIGAGTLGLATVAALHHLRADVSSILSVAKYPEQRRLAAALGATEVVEPAELRRAVRRRSGSWILDGGQLSGGAPVVFDCVGSAASIADALAVAAPGATVVLLGMPGHVGIDLTALWQREIHLVGAYAYGPEPAAGGRHSFDLATELVERAGLDRLVSSSYPLEHHVAAIDHAAHAGPRGAVKVVFEPRQGRKR